MLMVWFGQTRMLEGVDLEKAEYTVYDGKNLI